jgi:plasmid stability protein
MPVMLQVRNLPDDVHAKLKERAALARMSLSDFAAQELAKAVMYNVTPQESIERFRRLHPEALTMKPGEAAHHVDAARAERDTNLTSGDSER